MVRPQLVGVLLLVGGVVKRAAGKLKVGDKIAIGVPPDEVVVIEVLGLTRHGGLTSIQGVTQMAYPVQLIVADDLTYELAKKEAEA